MLNMVYLMNVFDKIDLILSRRYFVPNQIKQTSFNVMYNNSYLFGNFTVGLNCTHN